MYFCVTKIIHNQKVTIVVVTFWLLPLTSIVINLLTMKKIFLLFIGLVLLACKKEEQNKPIENTDPKLQTAISILKGDMILGQHVKMAGVDKSLLPSGVPTKFTFTWDDASKRLKMHLEKIQPGTMPFAVTMQASLQVMELSYWDKNEYNGNWIKFYDKAAVTTPYVPDDYKGAPITKEGSTVVTGFFNIDTHEVYFLIQYNMMNVVGTVFKQRIDPSRLANFQEELDAYEEALAERKLDTGAESFHSDNNQKTITLFTNTQTITAKLTYEGKTTDVALPIAFAWDGKEPNNVTGRMQLLLGKTAVSGANMQLSFNGKARFIDVLTKSEESIYGQGNSDKAKLKAVGVSTTLWDATGARTLKTSAKGEVRMIVNVEKKVTSFSYINKELGLSIYAKEVAITP